MASVQSPLNYSDTFSFPLSLDELWFWQIKSCKSKAQIASGLSRLGYSSYRGYYFLTGRRKIVDLRLANAQFSKNKWVIAQKTVLLLKRIPTIEAIFVTGALSMDNSPRHDDIDFMIITSPNTLWLTRLLVIVLLNKSRRPKQLPEHSSPKVSDKICDNLYLDSNHLSIPHTPSIYLAHETLQARCIFDRSGVHRRFLESNSWVKNYLPIAYRESLKKISKKLICNKKYAISNFLYPVNLLLFWLQYLYMLPSMTTERVSLGYAFFHPKRGNSLVSKAPTA